MKWSRGKKWAIILFFNLITQLQAHHLDSETGYYNYVKDPKVQFPFLFIEGLQRNNPQSCQGPMQRDVQQRRSLAESLLKRRSQAARAPAFVHIGLSITSSAVIANVNPGLPRANQIHWTALLSKLFLSLRLEFLSRGELL